MFNWLRRKVQLKAAEMQTQDIQRFLAIPKGMTDEEIGMLVAVATGIRLKMEEHGHDIEAEMEASVPELADLAKSAVSLSKTIEDAQRSPQKREPGMSMMVWLHSVRAYVNPEIRHLAQAMWKELQRGFPYADEQCEFIRSAKLFNMPVVAELHTNYVPCLLRPFR